MTTEHGDGRLDLEQFLTAIAESDIRPEYSRAREARVSLFTGGDARADVLVSFTGTLDYWVRSVSFTLACAVNAAARQVLVSLLDSTGTPVFTVPAPATQGSGQTVRYSFAPLVPAFGSAALGAMGGPFDGGELPPNLDLAVHVGAAVAGDLVKLGRVVVLQRPERLPGPREQ